MKKGRQNHVHGILGEDLLDEDQGTMSKDLGHNFGHM